MIVHPRLPSDPYNSRQLQELVDKYQQVTQTTARSFINAVEEVIKDNFNDCDLLDHSNIETVKTCFLVNTGPTAKAEIFFHSVLKEALDYNLYHSIRDLRLLLKSIKHS